MKKWVQYSAQMELALPWIWHGRRYWKPQASDAHCQSEWGLLLHASALDWNVAKLDLWQQQSNHNANRL